MNPFQESLAEVAEVADATMPLRRYCSRTGLTETGIPWIQAMPNAWTTQPLRRIGWFKAGAGFPDSEQGVRDAEIPFFKVATLADNSSGVFIGEAEHTVTRDTARRLGATVFPAYSIVFAKVGAALLLNRRKLLGRPACIDNNMMAFIATRGDVRFIYYYLLDLDFGRLANPGAVPSLNAGDIRNVVITWPPLDEQRAIAAFLDRETARIDALIAKKQRLIELLQEKRTALISHAVTRGLNLAAPMKPSGIDWLGDIPAHWATWKVTHGFQRLGSGTTPKSDNLNYYDGDIPWVTTSELREAGIADTISKVTNAAIRDYPTLRLYPEGTLLFAMYGATIGRMGILDIPATVNQACAAFVNPKHLDTRFTYYWLQMRRPSLIALSTGGGQPNLSQDDLRQVRIPAPPLDEQRAIVEHIEHELAKLEPLETRVLKAIDRLREYRSALISAAVTGRINVRAPSAPSMPIGAGVSAVAEQAAKPTRKANKHFCRCVLAAEIIDQHAMNPRFGRIKLQKLLILAEGHLRLTQIQSEPLRGAAGPFDNQMMRAIHTQLGRQKWYTVAKTDHGTTYTPSDNHGGHREYFGRYWGGKRDQFDALMALFKNATTEQAEIAATLYSAWNDFLIDGVDFDDKRLVDEVLSNWDPAKQRIEPARWFAAIKWMREKGLVPTGFGSHTRSIR